MLFLLVFLLLLLRARPPSHQHAVHTHSARFRYNTSYGRESAARTKPPSTLPPRQRQAFHFRVMVHPRAGIFATQTRVTRPSTFDSHVPHWPSSQLNLIGARAALTTSFMRWPGMAWTVRDPILTGTVFFWVERPLPAFGLLSKDSFLKALSKKPLRGVRGCRRAPGALGTRAAAPVSSARLRRVRILGVLGGLRCGFLRCEQARQ
jgi:hypothetical protein